MGQKAKGQQDPGTRDRLSRWANRPKGQQIQCPAGQQVGRTKGTGSLSVKRDKGQKDQQVGSPPVPLSNQDRRHVVPVGLRDRRSKRLRGSPIQQDQRPTGPRDNRTSGPQTHCPNRPKGPGPTRPPQQARQQHRDHTGPDGLTCRPASILGDSGRSAPTRTSDRFPFPGFRVPSLPVPATPAFLVDCWAKDSTPPPLPPVSGLWVPLHPGGVSTW